MVDCNIEYTIKMNENTDNAGTFNWGGITNEISGNTYFINNRLGF